MGSKDLVQRLSLHSIVGQRARPVGVYILYLRRRHTRVVQGAGKSGHQAFHLGVKEIRRVCGHSEPFDFH